MKKRWKNSLAAVLLFSVICGGTVLAAEKPGGILSFGSEENSIVLYVQDPGEAYEVQCLIGTSEPETVESHRITEDETPIETIILVDNSNSIADKYHQMIKTILSEIAANRLNGELFTVATFSDQVRYLIEDCSDYTQVKQTVEGIDYQDQVTYLTDVLYDMLTKMNGENDTGLKRIVIVSDGVDNKEIGYTKEELYALLEAKPYPIYTIGCSNKDNNEELKNMFALSRMTGGDYYLLDEVEDPMAVVNGMAALNNSVKVTVTPKAADSDGTKKGMKLTVISGGESTVNTLEIMMPFVTAEETVRETTPEETIESETPAKEEPGPVMIPLPVLLTGIGAVLFVLVVVTVVCLIVRKKKKENVFAAAEFPDSGESVSDRSPGPRRTQMSGQENQSSGKRRPTVYMFGEHAHHMLIMEDLNNPMKRFEVPLDAPVLVGYNANCQMRLDYDETVSGEHCRIYSENGKFYVENLSRTNGTYIGENQVINTAEIYTGCILVLGMLHMKVEIQ